jgi:nucleotide-binding universal stress UspA family protein
MVMMKREWSKPSTILFATECPVNEKAFTVALAQAKESNANLVVLHVCGEKSRARLAATGTPGTVPPSIAAFGELTHHAGELNVPCDVEVREGVAAEEILNFLRRRSVDRVVIGVHTPGPIGKRLVGSVAETLLRRADVPVTVVGPYLKDGTYRDFMARTVLCAVSEHRSSGAVARFAAEVAARHGARLIVHQAIAPQECRQALGSRGIEQRESDLLEMIPLKLRGKVSARTLVTLGDPTEELLYQGRVFEADLMVMGAHHATHFAALTNAGSVYKVLAYAHCPVLTLSPVVLADNRPSFEVLRPETVNYLAGVV